MALESGTVHLLSGGEAPLPRAGIAAYSRYATDKADGIFGRQRLEAELDKVRGRLARLMGIEQPERIGFLASVSAALTAALNAIDWREGDNVVALSDDFPSVVLAGAGLARFGVVLRVVDANPDAVEDALLAAIDSRSRLVLVSHVSYRHGRRHDIAGLALRLHQHGVALALDVSHSLGVLPVPSDAADIMVSCGHKFLFGSHGTGILVWNDARLGEPKTPAAGWFSVTDYAAASNGVDFAPKRGAAAFELGNPDFPALYALGAGLDVLASAQASTVASHAMALSGELRNRLERLEWPVWTPAEEERRGTSIALRTNHSVELATRLAEARILVASGNGRLRISVHGFNSMADIETLLVTLGAP
ncbi:aminotransferase class V-fold PLP-dependent enzyme [Mesorhizobium caraganae]|uniref:aminotransferase class V-fold PLP-dependent enzyme n=1 Tax=Mesorhizobium caraganae TaxID=483206 RepID=UPI001939615B|nr:aminotransferase class V-fold PLP-dependent enzyme [Mesorhizobium caraganae]MBM2712931.1 aminotransferase class V-fold PLP-dependent enzyme [Mesorhizobium caraganae]